MTIFKNRLVSAAATATMFFAGLGNAETREVQSLDGTSIGFEWFSPNQSQSGFVNPVVWGRSSPTTPKKRRSASSSLRLMLLRQPNTYR